MDVNHFDQNNPVQTLYSIFFKKKKSQKVHFWLIPSLSLHGLAMPEDGWLNSEEDTFALGWYLYFLFPGIWLQCGV